MKNIFSKKISAVMLTVAILFTTVFSMSIYANAASTYTPRLSAPSSSNKYYYSDLNVFYKYGWGMPNCTAYAYGRAYEILKSEPKLSWGNAEDWYGYNKSNGYYKYGKTPKLGAIACWYYNGGGGHVAVVEKIENGTITFSNSAWSGTNFYLSYASTSDSNAGGQSWWNFQGYIYIGDFSSSQEETTAPKKYSTGIYKTNVSDSLNMRSGAGTSNGIVASIPNAVKLTVTKVSDNWGYTSYSGKNGWVCLDYCDFVSQLPATEPTTQPTTAAPTTQPTTAQPTTQPTTAAPTTEPTTTAPTTEPTTSKPSGGLGVGDINCDGQWTIVDVTLIQLHLANQVELTDEQISYCDFNFDGKVTVADVTCMQKFLANAYH